MENYVKKVNRIFENGTLTEMSRRCQAGTPFDIINQLTAVQFVTIITRWQIRRCATKSKSKELSSKTEVTN